MSRRPVTSRLKVNPPLGRLPVLQYVTPDELAIDASYQRSLEARESQRLIGTIAQHWNWDLCQPLVVSRRPSTGSGGAQYFVIDGQHRLAACRLRGDIAQLPCVVVEYTSAADEAASFVHLNQQRKPLSKLDLFKAALASEDDHARAIMAAINGAGLSLAPHMNATVWKPGMVSNIGGIERAWSKYGPLATREALECLSTAFAGEVLKYAGTIFPGIVAVCAAETHDREGFEPGRFASFTAKLGARGQTRLREDVLLESAADAGLGRVGAAVRVLTELWRPERKADREAIARAAGLPVPAPAATPIGEGLDPALFTRRAIDGPEDTPTAWCEQCEMRVTQAQAEGCKSPWCSLKKATASSSSAVGQRDKAA